MYDSNRYKLACIIKIRVIIAIISIVNLIQLTVSGKNKMYGSLSLGVLARNTFRFLLS